MFFVYIMLLIYFPDEVSDYSGHAMLNIFHYIFYDGLFVATWLYLKSFPKSSVTSLWKDFLIDDWCVRALLLWVGSLCACGPGCYKEPFWPNHKDQTKKQNFSLTLYSYLPPASYIALVLPLLKFLWWLPTTINYNVEV